MPEVTAHPPGAPSWAELATTDDTAALAFYSAIFGWQDDPQEMGPGWYYHVQKLNGLETASIYQQSNEERAQNIPPHWNTYFTVNHIEESLNAIAQHGGANVFGPMDVFDAGRMAMCQDPQGAPFAIWQPNQHIGCRLKNETGAMCWNELLTTDRPAAIAFYQAALGLQPGDVIGPQQYAMLRAAETEVAGVMQIAPEMGQFPPHWTVYFAVENLDASLAQAQTLGATIYVPATDIAPDETQPPIGRFAALADPQGAAFSIFQPLPEPPSP